MKNKSQEKFIGLNTNRKIQKSNKNDIFQWYHMTYKNLPKEVLDKMMLEVIQLGRNI